MLALTTTQVDSRLSRSASSDAGTNEPSDARSHYALAIVGCGPRGLQCLLSICEVFESRLHGFDSETEQLHIVVFDDAKTLGAGPVYEPSQPDYLLMNYPSDRVSFAQPDVSSDAAGVTPSFLEWCRSTGVDPIHEFMPRSVVGRYLSWILTHALDRLEPFATVEFVCESVRDVVLTDQQWNVRTKHEQRTADELVITTGHSGWPRSNLPETGDLLGVYPVEQHLNQQAVPTGTNAVVIGQSLTAIDALLALTIGRGGSFEETPRGFQYVASRREPRAIQLMSRSGKPMLPKPAARVSRSLDALHAIWSDCEAALRQIKTPLSSDQFEQQWFRALLTATDQVLAETTQVSDHPPACQWYSAWQSTSMGHYDALLTLREALSAATAAKPLSVPIVLGHAWRRMYPVLVERLSHGGIHQTGWRSYSRIAREMERIAFGPPVENVRRLIALYNAGIVTSQCGTNAKRLRAVGTFVPGQGRHHTIAIDARIALPAKWVEGGLLGELSERGYCRQNKTHGGLIVNRDGQVIQASGSANAMMFVFGRATEGIVIGNDTLSRTLHDSIRRWSAGLFSRVTSKSASPHVALP